MLLSLATAGMSTMQVGCLTSSSECFSRPSSQSPWNRPRLRAYTERRLFGIRSRCTTAVAVVSACLTLKRTVGNWQRESLALTRRKWHVTIFSSSSAITPGGHLCAWLSKYGYLNSPTVIPVGDPAGAERRFRVRCQIRARQAEHTLLLTFKMDGAPMGQYLGQRHHRIAPDIWTDIDDNFEQSFPANCRLRLEDRSVSAAPSRLEIRDLVVTEHEPPLNLIPVAT